MTITSSPGGEIIRSLSPDKNSTGPDRTLRVAVVADCFSDSVIAATINTLKMADGFSKLGHRVNFISYAGRNGPTMLDEVRRDFSLSDSIEFVQMPWNLLGINFRYSPAFAGFALLQSLRRNVDFCYCRQPVAPVWLSRFGIPVAAETHEPRLTRNRRLGAMLERGARQADFRCLVTISGSLKETYERAGFPADRILIVPDAVDTELFRRPPDFVRSARSKPQIVYAGHLYDFKGIPAILDAANVLPGCDFRLIGGHPADIERQDAEIRKRNLANVELVGWVPHAELPSYLWNADILLLPPSARHETADSTSPIKLGEYLISGTPVVATNIGGIRYWVSDDEVLFTEPDDGASLAAGIRRALDEKSEADRRVANGARLAEAMSYSNRARAILRHCGFSG